MECAIKALEQPELYEDAVSRQAAIDAMCNACSDWCDEGVCKKVSALQKLPSAQPEIIRCKDCKYWREYKYANGKPKYLPYCGFNDTYFREDDFCSKAERR